jgi:hypothetical protein
MSMPLSTGASFSSTGNSKIDAKFAEVFPKLSGKHQAEVANFFQCQHQPRT